MKIFLIFICVMPFSLLHCMDSEFNPVLSGIIVHHSDHDEHRVLARVNKLFNKTIEENYRPSKKQIEQFMCEKGTPLVSAHTTWNKDFSKCAWVTLKDDAYLGLTLVGIEGKKIITRLGERWGSVSPAIKKTPYRPIFSKENTVCWYAFGHLSPSYEYTCFEYSLNFHGKTKIKKCVFELNHNGARYDFVLLVNLCALIKAFLGSTDVVKENNLKIYRISGACIPENYKSIQSGRYYSYKLLDSKIKDAIKKQYKTQQYGKS